jgi:hypothetical protein
MYYLQKFIKRVLSFSSSIIMVVSYLQARLIHTRTWNTLSPERNGKTMQVTYVKNHEETETKYAETGEN